MSAVKTVTRSSSHSHLKSKVQDAIEFARQAETLGQLTPDQEDENTGPTQAVEAKFVTAQDPVIVTANGGRLPAVPIEEATKLNRLRDELEGRDPSKSNPVKGGTRKAKDGTIHGVRPSDEAESQSPDANASLKDAIPLSRTNPLFPPLPVWGPPTPLRNLQCWFFRCTSAVLSFLFLLVIILGAAFTSIPAGFSNLGLWLTFRNPEKRRPFFDEEQRRRKARKEADNSWKSKNDEKQDSTGSDEYTPLEGGPDKLVCDPAYYARRVGLDCEIFLVQTEDGFIIELWHIFNPKERQAANSEERKPHSPDIFPQDEDDSVHETGLPDSQKSDNKRYPVLLVHGLLQSAGAYCTNDDESLAFYLAKSGYDVWLGNNRCGFRPRHNLLKYEDPRMWAWNIRQMGVMDLPALISRVLTETGFPKLALVSHSQGTTQSFVALAKEQRPDIGEKISVFCALAPAAYAGPLIGKAYFKFMRIVSTNMFRVIFGIHAFIPFMMTMHATLPASFYGAMGYRVFAFLFNWTDARWERDLRARLFQFAPVYVSAESMRWWLGRNCFAKHKCILATREERRIEDEEDGETEDKENEEYFKEQKMHPSERKNPEDESETPHHHRKYAWYDERAPPFALWVAGSDDLVDGRRLLRRFERGREPYVDVVHAKIIEGYEHLDVLWAIDAMEKVGKEVREVIWRTLPKELRGTCRVPKGCEGVEPWERTNGRYILREDGEVGNVVTLEVDSTKGDYEREKREDEKDLVDGEMKER
ncbi:alpha/beta-hydrolase [Patellaria atrata CBS 101060]|uniref:Alpha/beta-hydrolase n=1 Tax=Patellaria atrata CBS 101060 TaxID=1346257 RepID=A0A9P4S7N8_9PEZI|nr:alpha/beta-hydrolase [Patellaria atrata CBS 101060]